VRESSSASPPITLGGAYYKQGRELWAGACRSTATAAFNHSSTSSPGGITPQAHPSWGAYYNARAGAEAQHHALNLPLAVHRYLEPWAVCHALPPFSHSRGGCCGPHATRLTKKELLITDEMAKRSPDQLSVLL